MEDGVQLTEGGAYATTTLSIKPLAKFYLAKHWILEQLVLRQCIWFIEIVKKKKKHWVDFFYSRVVLLTHHVKVNFP